MSNPNDLTTAFLQQQKNLKIAPAKQPINAFNAIFSVQDLSEEEHRFIEQIFVDSGPVEEGERRADLFEVKRITKELIAIKRQETILIGERIAQARNIFKRYKERNFREWMQFTFGSFKTGYNYLAFYDLYSAIPEELKELIKEMPAKAVYALASKKMPIEQKIQILRNPTHFSTQKQPKQESEVHSTQLLIQSIQKSIGKLSFYRDLLTQEQKKALREIKEHIQNLIDPI